jgi:hypothetical protein
MVWVKPQNNCIIKTKQDEGHVIHFRIVLIYELCQYLDTAQNSGNLELWVNMGLFMLGNAENLII